MKITEVRGLKLRIPCAEISDSLGTSTARQAFLIQICTDVGLTGIGEAFTFGAPLRAMEAILNDQIAPVVLGQNPENIERLWQTMYWRTIANGRRSLTMAVISGVDTALWDLAGKSYGVPVCSLLGKQLDKIPSYASGGFYAPGKGVDGLRREMEDYMKKGYKDAKLKLGRCITRPDAPLQYMENQSCIVSPEEDWQRVKVAKEVVGDGTLIVDTNASWSINQVLQNAPKLLELGVGVIEEPIPFEYLKGYADLAQSYPQLLTAGCETQQGVANFAALLNEGKVSIAQPDVGWAGGISETKKIGAAALSAGKPISLHCFGSAVLFAASLQVAAAMSNTIAMESEENPNPLKTELAKIPFATDEHMNFQVPMQPGLGIELDWDKVEAYSVK